MDIKLYNSLNRETEVFKPIEKGKVKMYHCGPTVYDSVHIGNLRSFIFADLIRRTFEYLDYEVKQVMNITDVDDKTIKRSLAEKISLKTLTEKYEKVFLEDIKKLNIETPHVIPRASENIEEMIEMIKTLLDKKYAYIAEDGVYMSIDKVKNYGELAKLKPIEKNLETNDGDENKHNRINNDEYDKDNPRDFVLWKFWKESDGENFWDSPFGKGRPGWHIECSAMSIKNLGETFDIHTGGVDLIFPHHTNEIAQSESATDKKYVNYWLHGAFMNVNDEKMSKSKNNFTKLADLEENKISPLAFRYWLLNGHYRTQLNFTLESVEAAQNAYLKLAHIVVAWKNLNKNNESENGKINEAYKNDFINAISNDFSIPQALAITWEMLKDSKLSENDRLATLLDFDRVFGLNLKTFLDIDIKEEKIPEEIIALAEFREVARTEKDFEKADALRKEIMERGYEIKDSENGPILTKI